MMMDPFPKMCEYLKPVEGKEFEIVHRELTEEQIKFGKLRDFINARREFDGQEPGTIVQLGNKHGGLLMTDTEMERLTNISFYEHAQGNVLIGGLGLGMILLAAQAKEKVDSITVVEIHQEVIDLVATQLPLNGKVTIICDDVFVWYPPKGVKYSTIYFDIWNSICDDDYEEMKKLHRRFARRLNRENPDFWMSSWRHAETKASVYRSRRNKFQWEDDIWKRESALM